MIGNPLLFTFECDCGFIVFSVPGCSGLVRVQCWIAAVVDVFGLRCCCVCVAQCLLPYIVFRWPGVFHCMISSYC